MGNIKKCKRPNPGKLEKLIKLTVISVKLESCISNPSIVNSNLIKQLKEKTNSTHHCLLI
jgi:hypothetical protein